VFAVETALRRRRRQVNPPASEGGRYKSQVKRNFCGVAVFFSPEHAVARLSHSTLDHPLPRGRFLLQNRPLRLRRHGQLLLAFVQRIVFCAPD
jgi:hypothetical protein